MKAYRQGGVLHTLASSRGGAGYTLLPPWPRHQPAVRLLHERGAQILLGWLLGWGSTSPTPREGVCLPLPVPSHPQALWRALLRKPKAPRRVEWFQIQTYFEGWWEGASLFIHPASLQREGSTSRHTLPMLLEAAPLPGRWCCGGAPRAGRWPPGYSGLCRAGPPGGNGGCGRLAAAGRARGSGHCWEWGQGQCARLCVSWGGRPLHLHRYVLLRARGRGREKGRGRGGEREGGGEVEMERLREARKQEDGRRRGLEGDPISGKLLRLVQVPRPPPNTYPSEKHRRGPGRPGLGSGGWAGVRQRGGGCPVP